MKNYKILACLSCLLIFMHFSSYAQIVINEDDMPVPGDTLRLSITASITVDFTKTGNDTTWNFSALTPSSQRLDSFVDVLNTPSLYWFVFIPNIVANLASPMTNAGIIPGLPVTEAFTFYKKTSSAYSDLGFAMMIQGIPLMAKYDNPDKYYAFPLATGSTWSSVSSLNLSLPGLASYFSTRQRTSQVDGWGTLITPFDTFETIRVKSNLISFDSVYIDSLGVGIPVSRNTTEYKWLAKGQGVPELQINQDGFSSTAIYRDIYRQSFFPMSVNLGPDTSVYKGTTITIHASVSGGTPPYRFLWNNLDTNQTIVVRIDSSQTFMVMVLDAANNVSFGMKTVTVKNNPGINEFTNEQIRIMPNPSNGKIHMTIPGLDGITVIRVFTMEGSIVKTAEVKFSSGTATADLSGLPAGLYILKFKSDSGLYSGKVLIQKP